MKGVMEGTSFHTFRRSLATFLFDRGANIKDVQVILGHKSERTTLRFYIKWNERKVKAKYLEIMDKKRRGKLALFKGKLET
jgi:integrase